MATSNEKIIIDIQADFSKTAKADNAVKNVKKLGEASEQSKKGLNGLSGGVKNFNDVLGKLGKAAIVVALLAKIKDLFMQNQFVADKFAFATNYLNIQLSSVVNTLVSATREAGKLTNNFENLKTFFGSAFQATILEFSNVVKTLEIAFYAADAGLKSIVGDMEGSAKSLAKVATLQVEIQEDQKKADELRKKEFESAKGALDEVITLYDELKKSLEKTGVSNEEASKKAQKMVDLTKLAAINNIKLTDTIADYEAKEEKLRQTRDNVTLSMTERTKASEQLAILIAKEKVETQALLQPQKELADLYVATFNRQEDVLKSLEAESKLKQDKARIESKSSEQLMSQNGLIQESIELIKTKNLAEVDLRDKEAMFRAEAIKDDLVRLNTIKQNLENQKTSTLLVYKEIIGKYKEGTTLRLAAEIAYAQKKQEIDQGILQADIDIADKMFAVNLQKTDDEIELLESQKENIILTNAFTFRKTTELNSLILAAQKRKLIDERTEALKAANGNRVAEAIINAKYDSLERQAEKKNRQERLKEALSDFQKALDAGQNVFNVFNELNNLKNQQDDQAIANLQSQTDASNKLIDDKIAAYDRELEARRAAIEGMNMSDEQRNLLLNNLDKEAIDRKNKYNQEKYAIELANYKAEEDLKRKQFERNKKFQLAQTAINIAAGIGQALGSAPPPLNFINAALVGIAGLVQLKKINEQQYQAGTPPELSTLYPKPARTTSSSSLSNVDSLGKAQLKTRQGPLDYLKVNVTETDIRRVSTRVEVVEHRSRIR
jgi:hypothetical protein